MCVRTNTTAESYINLCFTYCVFFCFFTVSVTLFSTVADEPQCEAKRLTSKY